MLVECCPEAHACDPQATVPLSVTLQAGNQLWLHMVADFVVWVLFCCCQAVQ